MATLRTPCRRILSQRIRPTAPRTICESTNSATNRLTTLHLQNTNKAFSDLVSKPKRHGRAAASLSAIPSRSYTCTPAHNQQTPSATHEASASSKSEPPPSKIYTFDEIQDLSTHPSPNTIVIDVREPSEVLGTGRIPGSKNVPISSAAESFFLSADEFEDRYGFDRPSSDHQVVFYCKAGVRSKAAARLASQAGFGGKIGEFPGSWIEWVEKGGKIERVE